MIVLVKTSNGMAWTEVSMMKRRWCEPVFQSAVKGCVDGLGVRVKRNEQALTAAGREWMAEWFIEVGNVCVNQELCLAWSVDDLWRSVFTLHITSRSVLTAVPVHVSRLWNPWKNTLGDSTLDLAHCFLNIFVSSSVPLFWLCLISFSSRKTTCLFLITQLFHLNPISYLHVSALASASR